MKYKPGDKVFVKWDGKIVEQEIFWIRGPDCNQYYHTDYDDYHNDESILGQIIDGKKVINSDAIVANQRELVRIEKSIQEILDWSKTP